MEVELLLSGLDEVCECEECEDLDLVWMGSACWFGWDQGINFTIEKIPCNCIIY